MLEHLLDQTFDRLSAADRRLSPELRLQEVGIVLVASDADAPGLRFITPYAAMTMGEYFMAKGRDVLVVLDDLTRHARAYRELSLLARRPPGREAFPGDIFYIHSRLLERSTQLVEALGGGSLTALPIIETQGQDMSAYIPTNLISITDGQVFLSPSLFHKGYLPAIEVGRSVSRVGGKAQYPAYRQVAGDLRLAYSQFEELETFSRFATRLDDQTRRAIEHGRRVREVLKQPERHPLSVGEQVVVLRVANAGLLDTLPLPGSAAHITLTVQALLDRIGDWERAGVRRIQLLYHRSEGGDRYRPVSLTLLPVELKRFSRAEAPAWPSRRLPTFRMSPATLLRRLVGQYLFVSLFRACAESLASEHASRRSAMQAAQRNLDERLDEVTQDFRRARQAVITAELLDLVGGFEVITGNG